MEMLGFRAKEKNLIRDKILPDCKWQMKILDFICRLKYEKINNNLIDYNAEFKTLFLSTIKVISTCLLLSLVKYFFYIQHYLLIHFC